MCIVFLMVFAHVRAKAIKRETMAFSTRGKFKLSEFVSQQCLHGDFPERVGGGGGAPSTMTEGVIVPFRGCNSWFGPT